jgi:hypothetical protein
MGVSGLADPYVWSSLIGRVTPLVMVVATLAVWSWRTRRAASALPSAPRQLVVPPSGHAQPEVASAADPPPGAPATPGPPPHGQG